MRFIKVGEESKFVRDYFRGRSKKQLKQALCETAWELICTGTLSACYEDDGVTLRLYWPENGEPLISDEDFR